LGKFVLWNFNQTGSRVDGYDFWREDPEKKDRFVKPIISGLHGAPTTFREESLEVLQSPGWRVAPASAWWKSTRLIEAESAAPWMGAPRSRWNFLSAHQTNTGSGDAIKVFVR
jgi:hypothetical protein